LATHVVTLTDPIDAAQAWVYIFRSSALTRTFTADYVSYEMITDRIVGPGLYALGFDDTFGFPDHLALGSEGPDLLDRAKLRITGTLLGLPFSINEENVTLDNVHALDGPVRVTRVSTVTLTVLGSSVSGVTPLFAYRSLVVQTLPMIIPGTPAQTAYMRASADWTEQASGLVFYDANNPAGVTIDGLPDTITTTPPTRWTQVTAVTATVVNVSAIPAGLGGVSSTYYRDDSAVDPSDTGDQRSYGDAGLQVENPTPGVYTRRGQIYVLTGTTGSVGSTYETYYDHPIQVSVESIPPMGHAYLPFVAME
jgi:hypothetical protein